MNVAQYAKMLGHTFLTNVVAVFDQEQITVRFVIKEGMGGPYSIWYHSLLPGREGRDMGSALLCASE